MKKVSTTRPLCSRRLSHRCARTGVRGRSCIADTLHDDVEIRPADALPVGRSPRSPGRLDPWLTSGSPASGSATSPIPRLVARVGAARLPRNHDRSSDRRLRRKADPEIVRHAKDRARLHAASSSLAVRALRDHLPRSRSSIIARRRVFPGKSTDSRPSRSAAHRHRRQAPREHADHKSRASSASAHRRPRERTPAAPA